MFSFVFYQSIRYFILDRRWSASCNWGDRVGKEKYWPWKFQWQQWEIRLVLPPTKGESLIAVIYFFPLWEKLFPRQGMFKSSDLFSASHWAQFLFVAVLQTMLKSLRYCEHPTLSVACILATAGRDGSKSEHVPSHL